MIWTQRMSTRSLVFALAVFGLAGAGLWWAAQYNTTKANTNNLTLASAPSATFGGSGFGNIPSPASGCWGATAITPINVTFNVTGVSGTPTNVEVSHQITHSWVGDIRATLIAPNAASHILYSRTGATSSAATGDSSNLIGPYGIKDSAVGTNWWTAAANETTGAAPIPAGDYKSTTPGGAAGGGVDTLITPSFASVTNPNGTWTLRFEDGCAGDTGAINAATLTIDTGPAVPADAPVDFDGDGKSDFSIVRNITPPPLQEEVRFPTRRSINESVKNPGVPTGNSPTVDELGPSPGSNLGWYISNSMNNTSRVQGFGQPTTDFWIPEDFDGDGQDDLAVWRGLAPNGPNGGFFFIFQSSNNTVNQIDFGVQGDNPTVVGDYDGDGNADPAVFRCPASPPGGQCTFFYRGSMNNPGGIVTYMPWGNNSSNNVRPYPGDFDGDGKYDFCTFENGLYALRRSSDNGVEWIRWGLSTDPVLAPGDYDGDGKTDFMNVRVGPSNSVQWWLLTRTNAQSTTTWGALIPNFTEFVAQGDYDGDGKIDIAVWRRNNSSNSGSFFYVLRSGTQSLQTFEWGSMNDAPVPGWTAN